MTTLTHSLVIASFVVGAIAGNLLFLQYLLRSRWRSSLTGRIVLALFAVSALSYDLSVTVLIWPGAFTAENGGIWVRIGLRFAIDAVLIALYVLVLKAQRRDREAVRTKDLLADTIEE
jgi:hypothetical protein